MASASFLVEDQELYAIPVDRWQPERPLADTSLFAGRGREWQELSARQAAAAPCTLSERFARST
jgi:hypothetical protein